MGVNILYVSVFCGENHTSFACIRYWHKGPASSVMVWTATGYTHTSLVRIDANLNANRFISYTLRPVIVPYLKSTLNIIF